MDRAVRVDYDKQCDGNSPISTASANYIASYVFNVKVRKVGVKTSFVGRQHFRIARWAASPCEFVVYVQRTMRLQMQYPSGTDVELSISSDKGSFTVPRVRDEAVSMIRNLLRLMETMKPVRI